MAIQSQIALFFLSTYLPAPKAPRRALFATIIAFRLAASKSSFIVTVNSKQSEGSDLVDAAAASSSEVKARHSFVLF
jgi:hypothetical protein